MFPRLKKVEPFDLRPPYLAYITSISVSIPTPWAVAGPHGQLASNILSSCMSGMVWCVMLPTFLIMLLVCRSTSLHLCFIMSFRSKVCFISKVPYMFIDFVGLCSWEIMYWVVSICPSVHYQGQGPGCLGPRPPCRKRFHFLGQYLKAVSKTDGNRKTGKKNYWKLENIKFPTESRKRTPYYPSSSKWRVVIHFSLLYCRSWILHWLIAFLYWQGAGSEVTGHNFKGEGGADTCPKYHG